MRPAPTQTLIARLKREAKARVKAEPISHSAALEEAAKTSGYASWHELIRAVPESVSTLKHPGLLIDPALPRNFDSTPNDKRSRQQLDEWWDRPFALTQPDGALLVRCLDGGAWDRSTNYGIAADENEALQLAIRKLAEWKGFRERPMPRSIEGGRCDLIRLPQRPDSEEEVILSDVTYEEAGEWIRANA